MQLSPGKNIRLFKNPILEKLTYVHPAIPIALWGPVSAYCFAMGIFNKTLNIQASIGLLIAGFLSWTVAEYLLHRFVFHFKPRNAFQERISFLIHGIHHDDPEDARRLLMPPAAAIILALIFYSLFLAILGKVAVNPFFSGFIVGYLCYDYIHFATHFVRPRTKWMQDLKRNHMLHHYVTPEKRFGVSGMFWDRVFKTQG